MGIDGIDKIGGSKGYATSILGGFNKPSDGGTASAIRGRNDEERIGALLGSGNINAPNPASNNF